MHVSILRVCCTNLMHIACNVAVHTKVYHNDLTNFKHAHVYASCVCVSVNTQTFRYGHQDNTFDKMQRSAPPPISEHTSRYGHQENTFDKVQRSAPPPIPDGTNAYDEVLRLRDELMVHSHACTHTHKHTHTRAYYHTHRQSRMNMHTHVSFSLENCVFLFWKAVTVV
jgi:hypothetical protein